MDFSITYTPEQENFRQEVHQWLQQHVPADLNRKPASDEESEALYQQRRELGRALGARGWLYPLAPKEYGGGGMDVDRALILQEEVSRLGLTLPPYYDTGGQMGGATIQVWGTEEQKQAFLPPIYRGLVRTWQLLSEPSAGSDLANVQTTAIRDGDSYVIDGQKIFVGSDHGADYLWTLCCTAPNGKRHENLSWFLIDATLPGITIQPMRLLSVHGEGGEDEGHKNIVYFDHVRVPAFYLVGGENNGWQAAMTHLEVEHGGTGMVLGDQLVDELIAYCQKTQRDDRPLIENPDVRDLLAEMYIRAQIVRLFSMRNFWLTYTRRPHSYEGPQASYYGKLTGLWMTHAVAEAIGPYALTNDPRWGALQGRTERQQRDGIVMMHPGGTADIQKIEIARRLGIGRPQGSSAARVQ